LVELVRKEILLVIALPVLDGEFTSIGFGTDVIPSAAAGTTELSIHVSTWQQAYISVRLD